MSPQANTFSKADLAFENQLKVHQKVYSNSTTNFTNNPNTDGSLGNKAKSTKLRALPVIDHHAQREKLQSIIGLCEEPTKASQPVGKKGSSIPPPNKRTNPMETAKVGKRQSSTAKLETDQQPHQPVQQPKIQRTSLIDRSKETKVVKNDRSYILPPKAGEARKRPLKYTKSSPAKDSKKTPAAPSKWLQTIVKQNYVYFATKLDEIELKKRVAVLRKMKLEWKRRVNLLQQFYRFKKYGEPVIIGEAEDMDEDEWKNSKEIQARLQKIEENRLKEMSLVDRLFTKNKVDEISDLHSIKEDSDDEEYIKQGDVQQSMLANFLKQFLQRETDTVALSVTKVGFFMIMCLQRRRYLKTYQSIRMI